MYRTIKKITLGSLSILGLSTLAWIILLMNPTISYSNKTQFDQVTVYHNNDLEENTESIVRNAISLIKNSNLYDKDFQIQLCLKDDKIYPNLHPTPGGSAYAFLNKTVIFACEPDFDKNVAEMKWEINNYELRKYNLTELLAHEFMHNLQCNYDYKYYCKTTLGQLNWKLEGHAEYIARNFKNDDRLKEKIAILLTESTKEHRGIPVFLRDDRTIQNLEYYKYALLTQYLLEIKELHFGDICNHNTDIEKLYSEMISWSKSNK